MDTFATLADLEAYLGRSVDATRGELVLELASAEVRAHLRQQVNRTSETVTFPPSGGRVLLLPELPVWEVTDVTETIGDTVTALTAGTDYRLDAGHDNRRAELVRLGGSVWAGTVELTYDHGYDPAGSSGDSEHPLPDVFRLVTIRVAVRGLSNPAGNRQETIGRYGYTAGGAGDSLGLSLTAADQDQLAAYHPGTKAGARA